MRVCFYGYGIGVRASGVSNLMCDLSAALARNGCDVTIAAKPPIGSRNTGPSEVRYLPLAHNSRLSRNVDLSFVASTVITFFRRRGQFDVLHSMAGWHRFALAARMAGIAAGVPVVHSALAPAPRDWWFRGFAKVHCTNQGYARQVPNSVYIPPFLNLERFSPKEGSLPRKSETVTIGTMGAPDPRKGIQTLVSALPDIVRRHPHARISLAIEPSQIKVDNDLRLSATRIREDLRAQGLDGRVDLLGDIDPASFLQGLDIFVLPVQTPSGMVDPPLTLLEAMASGCSIVTSRVSGIGDILTSGHNALLVDFEDRHDPTKYAKFIHQLVDDEMLRKKLGAQARRDVCQFDVTKVAGKFMELYSTLIRRPVAHEKNAFTR